MRPRHEAATDRDGGDTADGTEASVGDGGDTTERQLLGCLLHCETVEQIHVITFAVPAEAFADPLNAAIWRTVQALADQGVCDPASVAMMTVVAKQWPQDLHHEVTARVIDAITGCVFPTVWRPLAAEVIDAHARRLASRHLAAVAANLRTAHIADLGRGLFTAAEVVETCQGWIRHVITTREVA